MFLLLKWWHASKIHWTKLSLHFKLVWGENDLLSHDEITMQSTKQKVMHVVWKGKDGWVMLCFDCDTIWRFKLHNLEWVPTLEYFKRMQTEDLIKPNWNSLTHSAHLFNVGLMSEESGECFQESSTSSTLTSLSLNSSSSNSLNLNSSTLSNSHQLREVFTSTWGDHYLLWRKPIGKNQILKNQSHQILPYPVMQRRNIEIPEEYWQIAQACRQGHWVSEWWNTFKGVFTVMLLITLF